MAERSLTKRPFTHRQGLTPFADAPMTSAMAQKIVPFLSYRKGNAEEAAKLYVSTFESDCRLGDIVRAPDGKVVTVGFTLFGTDYLALNVHDTDDFQFSNGISLMVQCETQAEIDRYWSKLTADGGKEVACGWCKDKFDVPWQIIPRQFGEMMRDKDRAKAGRAFQAMMTMKKMDLATLQKAFDGG